MAAYKVVEESRRIRGEAYGALKECRANLSNKDLLHIKYNFCDVLITCVRYMFQKECKNGPEKSSCFYTLNHLQSIKETIFTLINVSGGTVNPFVRWLDIDEAFNESLKVGMIKNFGFVDIGEFLNACQDIFQQKVIEVNKTIKTYANFDGIFSLTKSDRVIQENKSFVTKTFSIFMFSNLTELFQENVVEFLKKTIEEFQETDSGWTLKEINFLTIHMQDFNPMRAGTFIELPIFIQEKKACVNVVNSDNMCFKWSVLAGLKQLDISENHKQGIATPNLRNANRVSIYKNCESEYDLDFSEINFPTPVEDIEKFEKKNNISINLYILQEYENGESKIVIAQPSSISKQKKHINLLLLQDVNEIEEDLCENTSIDLEYLNITKKRKVTILQQSYKFHYVYIKNLSRLVDAQVSKRKTRRFFCDLCFHFYECVESLEEHEKRCRNINECQIILPDPNDEEESCVQFKNFNYKLKVPFVIYSDFESVLKPIKDDVRKEAQHEPVSVGYYLKCR